MIEKLVEKVKLAGVVGAGGAGFPTHVKLSTKVEYVILNAAECEPLIRVDQELLDKRALKVIEGLQMILEVTEGKMAFIAVKEKHQEVIKKLEDVLKDYVNIELFLLKDFYPAGDEQVTVYEVLKRIVPLGGIPLNVGCMVCNVETALNVLNAYNDIAVTTTYVTVIGDVPEPATYEIPIGVSYEDVLKSCGVKNLEHKVIIDGGPMMGQVITDFKKPITKTTKSIILIDETHSLIKNKTMSIHDSIKKSRTACIQCSKCTDLCPRDMLGHDVKPDKVMRIVNYGINDYKSMKTAIGCSECGACELYACPNDLSPRKINALIKQELRSAGITVDNKDKEFAAASFREYRKIPVKRLIRKLGIKQYDVKAPIKEWDHDNNKVIIPLKQHVGAPAIATVEIGTHVHKGELIARIPEDALGANVHASITGKIVGITANDIRIEAEQGGRDFG